MTRLVPTISTPLKNPVFLFYKIPVPELSSRTTVPARHLQSREITGEVMR